MDCIVHGVAKSQTGWSDFHRGVPDFGGRDEQVMQIKEGSWVRVDLAVGIRSINSRMPGEHRGGLETSLRK